VRWACILLPHLAMDGVLRGCADPAAPRVLVGGPAQRRVLQAANPAARALGLRPGLALAEARALAHGVAESECDPRELAAWQRLLAAWAYRFSSQVCLHGGNALLLEVAGSRALFGPWPRLQARLRAGLEELGFRHRIAAAPNPFAARALAGAHDGLAVDEGGLQRALGALPVQRAGFSPEVAQAFARMGLRQLRQVLALPREGIARRFPAEVLRHLDALLGRSPPVLDWYRPPDRFRARIELGYEVESSQALLFPLRRLTGDLAAYLAGRDGGVQRFVLRLEHEDRADTAVEVGLLAAEREPGLLFEIARGRLERAQVPAPVRALALHADELPAFVPAHRGLFDPRAQQALPWEQLRERLRARLGAEAVHGLRVHADHRPERAWRGEGAAESGRAPAPAPAAPRPGWLLPAPLPLRGGGLQVLSGPERIETGWWDGFDLRRDYYRLRTRAGQEAWAFLPAGEAAGEGGWMLHGWFA